MSRNEAVKMLKLVTPGRLRHIAIIFTLASTKIFAVSCEEKHSPDIFAEKVGHQASNIKKECMSEQLKWKDLQRLYPKISDKEFRDKLSKSSAINSSEVANRLIKNTRNIELTVKSKNSNNKQMRTANGFITLKRKN